MNQNKSLPFIIGGVVIILTLGLVFFQNTNKSEKYNPPTVKDNRAIAPADTTSTSNPSTNTDTKSASTSPKAYTLAEVAKHNSSADCWTAINGGVYDVTSWITEHPGGAGAIISLCGIDGSSAFDDQHGGQRRPENELASFKIGLLK